jgi:hypothetical protein
LIGQFFLVELWGVWKGENLWFWAALFELKTIAIFDEIYVFVEFEKKMFTSA